MNQQFNFKCASGELEEIPQQLLQKEQFSFPEVHLHAEEMVKLSKAIKDYRNEEYVKLPFCVTIEAEALGAKVNLGDKNIGPRISQYSINSIDELGDIPRINYRKNRIKEVLDAIQILSDEGEKAILSVQGPYTIAQSLIEPKLLFKAARKDKDKVDKLLNLIEDEVVGYIKEGINRGVKIISYSDSSGTLDILGPNMYEELSGKYNLNVLKKVSKVLKDGIIHICGVTSASLQNSGLIKSISYELNEELTYSEAINKVIDENKNIKVIGHNCINRFNMKMKKPKVWVIEW